MKKDQLRTEDYLNKRAWKRFLMSLPVGKAKGYPFESANDLNTIRVRAAQLNKDETCEKKFSVTIDFDTKVATITASNK